MLVLEVKGFLSLIGSNVNLQAAKRRLDELCIEKHPDIGSNVIVSWIAQGKVLVNKRIIDKAGTRIPADASIVINAKLEKYVCRWCLQAKE